MKYSVLNKGEGFFSSIHRLGKRIIANRVAAIIVCCGLQVSVTEALAQAQPPQMHMSFKDVAFGGNVFVAVGPGKPTGLVTSQDGIHWTNRDVSNVTQVAYGNGKFIAAGTNFYASDDGTNWISHTQPAAGTTGVEFVNGRFFGFGSQTISISEDGDTWTNSTQGINLSSIAFGNGLYVGVGGMGSNIAVITSTNGLDWTTPTTSTNGTLTKVVFAQGKFVATGSGSAFPAIEEGPGIILSSSDGAHWSTESVPQDPLSHLALNDLVYANDQFVAIGGSYKLSSGPVATRIIKGSIFTSPDGHTWTEHDSNTISYLTGITFAAGKYLAVGFEAFPSDLGDIISSTDGIHWQSISSPPADPLTQWEQVHQFPSPSQTFPGLQSVTYGSNVFVAAGPSGLFSSEDGLQWTNRNVGGVARVVYGNGTFVAAGTNFYVSTDGTNWVSSFQPSPGVTNVTFANGQFFASGGNIISVSQDAEHWTNSDIPIELSSVAYGNGVYVGVGQIGNRKNGGVITSTDGLHWTNQPIDLTEGMINIFEGWLTKVVFAQGKFFATANVTGPRTDSGSILSSADGTQWVKEFQTREFLNDLIYVNDQFLAAGGYIEGIYDMQSAVFVSRDGKTWNPGNDLLYKYSAPQPYLLLKGITFGAGKYIAIKSNDGRDLGDIFLSLDGDFWNSITTPLNLNSVTVGDNSFIAVGNAGTILRSVDANTWDKMQSPTTANLLKVIYGNGQFVAAGEGGTVLVSTNGINWVHSDTGTDFILQSLVYANNRFYAFGYKLVAVDPFSGALGYSYVPLVSTNAIQWSLGSAGGGGVFDMAYGNGVFVATGHLIAYGQMSQHGPAENIISTDGLSWTAQVMSGFEADFGSIEFGNGRFVTVGWQGPSTSTSTWILTSPDGRTSSGDGHTWAGNSFDVAVRNLSFGRDLFLAFGNSFVLSSKDGVTWNRTEMSQSPSISSAAYGQSKFVAVGENGAILVSAPFSGPWISSGSLHWSAQTQAGQNYVFEFTDTLPSTNWTSLAQIKGNGSEVMLSDTNTVSRQRYYRLRAE